MVTTNNRLPILQRLRLGLNVMLGRNPRNKRSLYDGADNNRLLADWLASKLSADDESRMSLPMLRARCRDLARNNGYAKHFLRMLAVNVIGPNGIRLQAQVRNNNGDLAKPLNDRIEAAWLEWSYRPTRDGKQTLTAFSQSILKTVAREGDVFVRVLDGFRKNKFRFALEPIDGELIDEQINEPAGEGRGEIRNGIEVDEDGRPLAYHGWNAPDSLMGLRSRKRVRYPASEIIHLYDPERVNSMRGVPWMASVMVPMKWLADYAESEAVAARVSAAKMGVFTKKDDASGTTLPEGQQSFDMPANPGSFMIAPSGWDLEMFSPDHPSQAYAAFIKSQLRDVATGLGVTYNALANDLEGVNYSSMRSGLLIERDLWKTYQEWWIGAFLMPIYRRWMDAALMAGALVLDARPFDRLVAAKWQARGWPWVDPQKDMAAGVEGIANGLASRTSLLAEQGEDFETVAEQLADEEKVAKAAGITLAKPQAPTPPGGAPPPNDGSGDATNSTGTNSAPNGHTRNGHARVPSFT